MMQRIEMGISSRCVLLLNHRPHRSVGRFRSNWFPGVTPKLVIVHRRFVDDTNWYARKRKGCLIGPSQSMRESGLLPHVAVRAASMIDIDHIDVSPLDLQNCDSEFSS